MRVLRALKSFSIRCMTWEIAIYILEKLWSCRLCLRGTSRPLIFIEGLEKQCSILCKNSKILLRILEDFKAHPMNLAGPLLSASWSLSKKYSRKFGKTSETSSVLLENIRGRSRYICGTCKQPSGLWFTSHFARCISEVVIYTLVLSRGIWSTENDLRSSKVEKVILGIHWSREEDFWESPRSSKRLLKSFPRLENPEVVWGSLENFRNSFQYIGRAWVIVIILKRVLITSNTSIQHYDLSICFF